MRDRSNPCHPVHMSRVTCGVQFLYREVDEVCVISLYFDDVAHVELNATLSSKFASFIFLF